MKTLLQKKREEIPLENIIEYAPIRSVSINFSIPDVYKYAKSKNKKLNELTEEELMQFEIKKEEENLGEKVYDRKR